MRILLYLVLFGLCAFAQKMENIVSVHFEITGNSSNTHLVPIGHMIETVRASKTKDLKITVEATGPVTVFLCNCSEKLFKLGETEKYTPDDLTLDTLGNLSMASCKEKGHSKMLEFEILGSPQTKGNIVLEVIDTKKHDSISLLYNFSIPDENGVYLNLTDFESVSRLAGLYQYNLQMKILVEENKNITSSFMKCGQKVLQLDKFIYNNMFTFEPGMLRMMDDVAEFACQNEKTPLQIYIGGASNTSGMLLFQIHQVQQEYYNSMFEGTDGILFPFIHLTIFALVVFTIIPLVWWAEKKHRKELKEDGFDDKDIASLWSL